MTRDDIERRTAALVIGHPGHELRVHRWLELARPVVHVITDGSGRTGRSRIPSTRSVLARAGARPGTANVFGCCSDAEVYTALLAGDLALPLRIVRSLAEALADVDYVVADALEGFNPSHDLCRFLVNAAVALVAERTGREVGNYDVLLDGNPRGSLDPPRPETAVLNLDDADLARKIEAAKGYPELRAETKNALQRFGAEAFRVEVLRPVTDRREGLDHLDEEPPYYERYGQGQVAAGHYRDVIGYRTNVRPLVHAVWRAVGLEPDGQRTVIAT